MALPSNVPAYGTVDLLDLDTIEYVIVQKPVGSSLRAWAKLEEAERRWTMFEWATFVITQPSRNVRLVRDFASAYLLSLEATLQVLQDQRRFPDLKAWLAKQQAYDLICRGLRTLRHLQAHITTVHVGARPNSLSYSRFAGAGGAGGNAAWAWADIAAADLVLLQRPPLEETERPAWNAHSASLLIPGLMRHGLTQYKALLESAGP
jgi:hypothetical protein